MSGELSETIRRVLVRFLDWEETYPEMGIGSEQEAIADYDRLTGALAEQFAHVGWLGPYGVVPGGLDNEPQAGWLPLYIVRPTAPPAPIPTKETPNG